MHEPLATTPALPRRCAMTDGMEPPLAPQAWHPDRFEALYARHAGPLYRFLYFRTGLEESTAAELCAEVFLGLWRHAPVGEEEFAPVLYGIARRKLADFYRGRSSRREILFSDLTDLDRRRLDGLLLDTDGLADAETALSGELRALLGAALSELDAETQELLLDKYVRGRSMRALAAQLGRSEAAVTSLLARARERLRKALATHMKTGDVS